MAEKIKKGLFALWVLWIIVFCLSTFTKVELFDTIENLFLMIVGSVHFFYLFLVKKGTMKWVCMFFCLVFMILFFVLGYAIIFKW